MQKVKIFFLTPFFFVFTSCFSVKNVIHSRVSIAHKRSVIEQKEEAAKKEWVNRVLNNIFDKKTVRYLVRVYDAQIDFGEFRRKKNSGKIKILCQIAPAISKFSCFPKKKEMVVLLVNRCIRDDFGYPHLVRFCKRFLGALIDDIKDIKAYTFFNKSLGYAAKRIACRYWLAAFESLDIREIVVPFLKYFHSSRYKFQTRFDFFLFVQQFSCLEGYLEKRKYRDNWEKSHKKFVVDKDTARSLRLMNYLWPEIKKRLGAVDKQEIISRVHRLNRKLVAGGIKHFFSACC